MSDMTEAGANQESLAGAVITRSLGGQRGRDSKLQPHYLKQSVGCRREKEHQFRNPNLCLLAVEPRGGI